MLGLCRPPTGPPHRRRSTLGPCRRPPAQPARPGPEGRYRRVLLLGGASEIGQEILAALRLPPGAEVLLAGRDEPRMAAAAQPLPCRVRTLPYDATALGTHQAVLEKAFAAGPVDLVISAAGRADPPAGARR